MRRDSAPLALHPAHRFRVRQDPAPEVPPEQTASILSFITYRFLDPIIWKAYSIPHLPYEQLPPQADYDYAKNLVKRAFPVSVSYSNRAFCSC